MAKDLKSYVDLFTAEDIEWVQKNKNTAKNTNDLTLSALRNRIWLRELDTRIQANRAPAAGWEPGA